MPANRHDQYPVPERVGRALVVYLGGITFRRYPADPRFGTRNYYTPGPGDRQKGYESYHREVWKRAHGTIPAGHHIHHRDGNPLNNRLENLECLPGADHLVRYHSEWEPERVSAQREWMEAVRSLAADWHASEEGLAWHRRHGKATWEGREPRTFRCDQCGAEFESRDGRPREHRFCSNKCKVAWRRATRADDETRVCAWCLCEFKVNRYLDARCCSKSCALYLLARGEGGVRGGPSASRAPRTCEWCGKSYRPNWGRQRACSRACGQRLRYRREAGGL